MPQSDPTLAPPLTHENSYSTQINYCYFMIMLGKEYAFQLNVLTLWLLVARCISFSLNDRHFPFRFIITYISLRRNSQITDKLPPNTCSKSSVPCDTWLVLVLLHYVNRRYSTLLLPLCCYTTERKGHYMPNVSNLTHGQTAHRHTKMHSKSIYAHTYTHLCCGCDLGAGRRLCYIQASTYRT